MTEHPPHVRLYKRLKHLLLYILVRLVAVLAPLCPDSWMVGCGRAMGSLLFALLPSMRHRTTQQLQRALGRPQQETQEIARGVFQHLGENFAEWLLISSWRRRMDDYVECDRWQLAEFNKDLNTGKGLIVATGHIGNWELVAQYMGCRGYRVNTIARTTFDPMLTEYLRRWRLQGGMRTIFRGTGSAVREMLRVFKRGEAIALLVDVDTRVPSSFVPYFGRLAKTPRAPGDLALRTGAALWFGYTVRTGTCRHKLVLERMSTEQTGNREQDSVAITAEITRRIEQVVAQHPDQWVWMHQRWKSRPEA